MIVGYQGEGSLGRQLVDGAKSVRIYGETIAVKARIHTLNGFSAHAGAERTDAVARPARRREARIVVLTHGEARGREPMAELIRSGMDSKPCCPCRATSSNCDSHEPHVRAHDELAQAALAGGHAFLRTGVVNRPAS